MLSGSTAGVITSEEMRRAGKTRRADLDRHMDAGSRCQEADRIECRS